MIPTGYECHQLTCNYLMPGPGPPPTRVGCILKGVFPLLPSHTLQRAQEENRTLYTHPSLKCKHCQVASFQGGSAVPFCPLLSARCLLPSSWLQWTSCWRRERRAEHSWCRLVPSLRGKGTHIYGATVTCRHCARHLCNTFITTL